MAGGKVAMKWQLVIAVRSSRTARTSTCRSTPAFEIPSAALHPIDPIFAKFSRCGHLAESFRKGWIQFLRTYGSCQRIGSRADISPAYGEQSVIERHCAPNQGCIGQRRAIARN